MVPDESAIVAALCDAGARFAYVHGSQARGTTAARSDLDVAAWWGTQEPPASWDVSVPDGTDLIVLDAAPFELAGRVAMWGRLLFDDDPPARVRWEASTRKVWLDERPRRSRTVQAYLAARARG